MIVLLTTIIFCPIASITSYWPWPLTTHLASARVMLPKTELLSLLQPFSTFQSLQDRVTDSQVAVSIDPCSFTSCCFTSSLLLHTHIVSFSVLSFACAAPLRVLHSTPDHSGVQETPLTTLSCSFRLCICFSALFLGLHYDEDKIWAYFYHLALHPLRIAICVSLTSESHLLN